MEKDTEEIANNEERTAESGWNLSQTDILLIAELKKQAITQYNLGQLKKSFFSWKSIKFVMSGRFEEEERQKLKDMERAMPDKDMNLYVQKLEDYIDELNRLMRKYRLDISDREKKIKLN